MKQRKNFSEDIKETVQELMPANFFEEADTVMSIGGAHGENPLAIAELVPSVSRLVIFDPVAEPAEYIRANISVWSYQARFQDIDLEQIRYTAPDDFIWEMSNTLQAMHEEEKEIVLRLMRAASEPGQKAVIVDEEPRKKTFGFIDKVLNLLYNPDQQIYDLLTPEEYIALFERCGFRTVVCKNYRRGLTVYLLEAV